MRTLFFITIALVLSECSSNKTATRNSPAKKIFNLNFTTEINSSFRFEYSDTTDNVFLRRLRKDNNLEELIKNCNSDLEKVIVLTDWTNKQWKHNGNNQPTKRDALTILSEAKQGKQFRCVEYGIVLSSVLNSIGIKARVVGLKTRDVEIVKSGAGHVLAEAYLGDRKKWVMADGQFNVVPMMGELPLNCVEFQNAIVKKKKFELVNINGKVQEDMLDYYLYFIPHYLYYFDTKFDNRFDADQAKFQIEGKDVLMLVPVGANNPHTFQVNNKIDYCLYTNSSADFYQEP